MSVTVVGAAFSIAERVVLRTDTERLPGIISTMQIDGNCGVLYRVSRGNCDSWHYDFELERGVGHIDFLLGVEAGGNA